MNNMRVFWTKLSYFIIFIEYILNSILSTMKRLGVFNLLVHLKVFSIDVFNRVQLVKTKTLKLNF